METQRVYNETSHNDLGSEIYSPQPFSPTDQNRGSMLINDLQNQPVQATPEYPIQISESSPKVLPKIWNILASVLT